MDHKKDKLERFVEENRSSFDQEMPSKDLWSGISKDIELPQKKKGLVIPLYRAFQYAAVLVVLVGLGVFYITQQVYRNDELSNNEINVDSTQNQTGQKQTEFNLASYSAELGEAEQYYENEVAYKLKEVESLKVDDEVLQEIQFLDEEFNALKEELGETNNEKIVNAMIENYQLKLSILENILEQYQKAGKTEKENEDEKTYL